ncbi:acyltransferase [Oxalobacteraceae bacterium R-40]|uniref:Acyltransferase n=1 Tax=Keguizhuia sedimenti TaxID=3064264 RepID=A0ABU1BJQ8_9BURK|nr:acyltransferase [Oxalobacteraceae bacterium R-40]
MIQSLEGLRGIAALIVALYHLKIGTEYVAVLKNGYLFVDLFFVLSGFVICAAYFSRMNSPQDFKPFVIRRFGRLFPLLVFSTILFVLLTNLIVLAKRLAVVYGYGGFLNNPDALTYLIPSAAEIFSTLTLTHSLGLFDDLILNTPSWSISTEFYTYLLFAAVCLIFPAKKRWPVFGLLTLFGMAVTIWSSISVHDCLEKGGCMGVTYDYGFLRCVYSFFLGALLYHFSRSFALPHAPLQVTGLVTLGLFFSLLAQFPAIAFLFPFAFSLLILSLAKDQGALAQVLNLRPFQILGQRSYSIYMLHMPLVLIFENIAKRVDGFISGAAVLITYVGVLLVLSGWSYRFIEDPFRERFNRLAGKKKTLSAAPMQAMEIKPSTPD